MAFDRKLRNQEITLTQCEVLLILSESGPIRQTDLADRILVNKASLIPMIERLERQGWIKKRSNKDDQRSYFVVLTEAGSKCADQIQASMKAIAKELSGGIGSTEVAALSDILDKISKNLEEEGK